MRVLTGDENIRHSESLRIYKADFLLWLSLSLKDSKDCKSFFLKLNKYMQQETGSNTLKLILDAMENDDISVRPDFLFAFKVDKLSAFYEGWNIVKFNENFVELHWILVGGYRN